MSEEYTKQNDYTLRIDFNMTAERRNDVDLMHGYTKYFNFSAREVTTVYRDWTAQAPKKFSTGYGSTGRLTAATGSSSVSTNIIVQKFSDIENIQEIEMMHAELESLGGKPPPLEDVLGGRYMPPKNKTPRIGRG